MEGKSPLLDRFLPVTLSSQCASLSNPALSSSLLAHCLSLPLSNQQQPLQETFHIGPHHCRGKASAKVAGIILVNIICVFDSWEYQVLPVDLGLFKNKAYKPY